MSSQGYNQIEIATQLQVDETIISKDMAHLRQQAQENLQKHIHEVVLEEYQKVWWDEAKPKAYSEDRRSSFRP